MAYRIPQTRRQFDQMDFMSQSRVKERLLRDNLCTMCDALNPENLKSFSPVLHKNDLEKLQKSKERDCKSNVIMDLLMIIPRSLKKDPSWWDILEKVLTEEENWHLYDKMNPWEDRNIHRGAAGGGGHGGGGGGGGGRGAGHGGGGGGGGRGDKETEGHGQLVPPAAISDVSGFSRVQKPYPNTTPLAQTTGLHSSLRPLFGHESRQQWRDLADKLGLNNGDQLDIMGKDPRDRPRLLLDKIIQSSKDEATVGSLVGALLELGKEGKGVVMEMANERLINPLHTEGSQADGEVVGGAMNDDETGGASARAYHAPPPIVPNVPANPLWRPSCDDSNNNLSFVQPPKADLQLDLSSFIQGPSSRSAEEAPTQLQPLIAGLQADLHQDRDPSEESIVDNDRQLKTASPTNGACMPDKKIQNCPPVAVPENAEERPSVEVDSAFSSCGIQKTSQAIADFSQSPQQMEDTAHAQPSSAAASPKFTIIYKPKHVVISQNNSVNEDRQERDEQYPDEYNSPTDDSSASSQAAPSAEVEGTEGRHYNEENPGESMSYRPDPLNSQQYQDYHQTALKQPFNSHHDDDDHSPLCAEVVAESSNSAGTDPSMPARDLQHDLVTEQQTPHSSAGTDPSMPAMPATDLQHDLVTEQQSAHSSAGIDPSMSDPDLQHDLVTEQPVLLEPPHSAGMSIFSRLWVTVIDTLHAIE